MTKHDTEKAILEALRLCPTGGRSCNEIAAELSLKEITVISTVLQLRYCNIIIDAPANRPLRKTQAARYCIKPGADLTDWFGPNV